MKPKSVERAKLCHKIDWSPFLAFFFHFSGSKRIFFSATFSRLTGVGSAQRSEVAKKRKCIYIKNKTAATTIAQLNEVTGWTKAKRCCKEKGTSSGSEMERRSSGCRCSCCY